ncbi:MAG: TonB-dependent receptor [Pseudomonadota bacterium]
MTGSLIPRADRETPSPIQMVTADDIAKSGASSLSEVLSNMTANGQGTLSQGFSGAFAGGAAGVALRGLTVGLTLVLVDGHRMTPYPLSDDNQRQFVDLSSIPLDAIDRIEVLKDGASASYGSDAIAGVVNVILKKSHNGTTVRSEYGTSEKGGGNISKASFTHGFGDLAKDGYNIFGTLEYRHRDKIKFSDRADELWASPDWTSRGGNNLTLGVPTTLNSNLTQASGPFLFNPNGPKVNGSAANNPNNFSFLSTACPNYSTYISGGCAVADTYRNIQPETKNLNLLVGATLNLDNDWTLAVKASLFDSQLHLERGLPATFTTTSFGGYNAFGPGENPQIVNRVPSAKIPSTYPGYQSSWGVNDPVRLYGYVPDIGQTTRRDYDTTTTRLAADLNGSAWGWDMNVAAGYSKAVTGIIYNGDVDRVALYNALTRSVSPFKATGGNSATDIATIAPTYTNRATNELTYLEARGSRELMDLPGGALGLATGASYIHKRLSVPQPLLQREGVVASGGFFAGGSANNTALFAEMNAPVLKGLELGLSGRVDHFDTYGNSATPKATFKWTPSSIFTLRGTAAKGFRAPAATENGEAATSFAAGNVNDPVLCPDAKTTTAGNVIAACNQAVAYLQKTNPDLAPEKSMSYTFGAILEPIKGWGTTIDMYKIKVDNQINVDALLPGFDNASHSVRNIPLPTLISDGGSASHTGTPAVGTVAYIQAMYVNVGSTETSGVELDTSYKFKLGDMGTLKTEFMINHMFSYLLEQAGTTYQLAGTHGPSGVSGDTGNPKNRAQFTLEWDKGPLNLKATTNWIDSFSVADPSVAADDCLTAYSDQAGRTYFQNLTQPAEFCNVGSFTTVDLALTYKMSKRWTLRANVQNLFDKQPPIDVGTYGNGSAQVGYNPSMHQSGAIGRFFSLGVNYQF